MWFEVLIALLLGAVMYIAVKYVTHLLELKQYPPGPTPLPIIGNVHQITDRPIVALKRLSKDYGNVMSVSLGMQRMVVILGIKEAREALITKAEPFAGRPQDNYATSTATRGFQDIFFGDYGPKLKMMRKVAHGALKMYGSGLFKLEEGVLAETEKLFQRFDEKEGKAFDPKYDMGLSVLNVICAVLFGRRYNSNDKEFLQIMEFVQLIGDFDFTAPVNYLPLLRLFPNKGLSDLKRGISMRDSFLVIKLQEHKATFDENNLRDFTDFVIDEFRKEGKEDKKALKYISDTNLEQILSDLFLASIGTTTTSLLWCLAYLATWPEIQEKIAEEQRFKIGNRRPRLSDRGSLHFFEAVIHETLRMSSVASLSVTRKTICDTECNGKRIPAGTHVWINAWAIHNDEREWKEPHLFKPERFLDADGSLLHSSKLSYLPFGAGRRVCVGESLAKMELFVLLSNILYRYEVQAGDKLPELEGNLSVVLTPKPYKIRLKTRNSSM